MALIIRTTAFWYVTPCIFIYWWQHFGETCCFLLQSRGPISSHLTPAICLDTLIVTAYIVTLKMEGADFSETLVSIYEITQWSVSFEANVYNKGAKLLYE